MNCEFQVAVGACEGSIALADVIRKKLGTDLLVGLCKQYEALNLVLKFPNISRPGIGLQQLDGFRTERSDLAVEFRMKLPMEKLCQGGNVLDAFAQGRDRHRKNIDPEEQILAEAPLLHCCFQVPVG